MYEDCFKYMLDLYSNPLFKKGFFDFFIKVQEEGIESARKFWTTYTAGRHKGIDWWGWRSMGAGRVLIGAGCSEVRRRIRLLVDQRAS